jgi:hypothetical protein
MVENGKGVGTLADGLHHVPPGVCEDLAKRYPGYDCSRAIQINAGEAPIGENKIIWVFAGMFFVFLFGALLPLKGGLEAWIGVEPNAKKEESPKQDLPTGPESH